MKKILLIFLLMVIGCGIIFAEGDGVEEEFLLLIPAASMSLVLAIATVMHGMKKWWDEQDKLKPYWLYFAVGFSFIAATIISAINGFDWSSTSSYMAWTAQVLLIYGGQHLFEQAWFKKWWPTIKELIPMFLKWVLKK